MHASAAGMLQIIECRVRTVSSKRKLTVKDKLVGRRSPEEITFLDDIVMFVVHSGARGDEELMSCERPDESRLVLSSRAVRDELKVTVKEEGLPELYFSSHTLSKGAITHMRALGASEDDRRERGNYTVGSTVMNSAYDYAVTGLGPSASNSLQGGRKPTINDLRRLVLPSDSRGGLPAAGSDKRDEVSHTWETVGEELPDPRPPFDPKPLSEN
jgi:hypothetical protein